MAPATDLPWLGFKKKFPMTIFSPRQKLKSHLEEAHRQQLEWLRQLEQQLLLDGGFKNKSSCF